MENMEAFETLLDFFHIGIWKCNFNVLIVLATMTIIFYWILNSPKGLPPGPIGFPIVGYLPYLGRKPHETFNKLSKKYGPVFNLYLGNRLVVVLNGYEPIKEAFVKQGDVFAGRPPLRGSAAELDDLTKRRLVSELPSYNFTEDNELAKTLWRWDVFSPLDITFNLIIKDVVVADGKIWKHHRRFALNLFRDLGVGKLSIEPLIMEEIQLFLTNLTRFNGKPKDFSKLLTSSVSSNMCILIFGKRFDYDDTWFNFMQRIIEESRTNTNATGVFQFFPWLTKLPLIGMLANQSDFIQHLKEFKETIYHQIKERNEHYIDGQRDNYMDALIGEQRARQEKDRDDNIFQDKAIEQNVRFLMIAGTETTANTLLWCILYMATYPTVQKKVQDEIDEIMGTERAPCWNDRLRMPYTEATIHEVQRIQTLVPIGIPHRNTEDCVLFGYNIPKDTYIISNLYAVHNDNNLWTQPEIFRPERFLSPNGETDKKEYLVPFSMGKRECLGIPLAKMELHLYLTAMLQKFTFHIPEGSTPSMESKVGFTATPKYFNITAVLRNTT